MFRLSALLLLLGTTLSASADDIFDGAPPVAPGFEDYRAAQQAVLTGKIKRVDPSPEVPDSVQFYDDVEFATPDGVSLTLDLYVPKDAEMAPPVLLFIHGGGWSSGAKESAAPYAVPLAEYGYAAASVQYRLAPTHRFPKAIQDVNSAIHWLRKHGDEYGFDGSRMAVLGGSAGGHLALLAAYAQDPALGAPEAPEGVKDRLEAVVNVYGVTDCTTAVAQASDEVNAFIGAPYAEAVDAHALASPIFHLDPNDPPTLTFHGTIDELVPISQADRLHSKLDALGVVNYYDRIDGWPHSMDLAQPIYDRCLFVVKRFLAKHLPIEQAFESIFDGESLSGWKAPDMSYWSVQDGAITAESTESNPCTANQFLVWEGGEVSDFELKLKFRLDRNHGNSGIQFRSRISAEGQGVGYQADILPSGAWLGALCDENTGRKTLVAPNGHKTVIDDDGTRITTAIGEPATLKEAGEWNEYHIIARGNHMILRVNGTVSAEVTDRETGHFDPSGILALQLRSGPPMKVQFKDILLKRLS